MTGIWTYVLLVVGFVLLIKGADFFVEGSSDVAKKLKVPSLIIGMTIVAMGTSLPECAVSITASISGNNQLAVSNVVGSNIFNLMVVCGACALFTPLMVDRDTLKKQFPLAILVGILLLVTGCIGMEVGHLDGILYLVIFALFLWWMVRSAMKARAAGQQVAVEGEPDVTKKTHPIWLCIIFIVGGAAAIAVGGDLVVDSAAVIAETFGLSQNLIGLTIVAVGTSLPELVTSLVAARKKELDMALGNVIGSNIFNVLMVLGIAAAISPVAFNMENVIDIILLTVMSLVVWAFAWSKQKIVRWEGAVMLAIYVGYMAYIIAR
ncbi:MAG: calcium/sodium antiporter [Lachnospiraceae bacterium]|nr:calcium/sodium antiporter [Lachnospiraceae bacterium]